TVTWAAPADGGSPVTGYKLSLNKGTAIPLAASATSHTFTVLGAGAYTATLIATNAVGESPASSASKSVSITASTAEPTAQAVETAAATSGGAPEWLAGAGILVALVAVGALALLGQRLFARRRTSAAPVGDQPDETSVPE
ncbi:MAG: fibronectin type III domain-containing protein, partial [Agromyces sp.]